MLIEQGPLISVIIPCYNQEAFLPQAIESVLAQDYSSFEIIVVDDGSLGNTAAVVARYPEVHCLKQENQGLSGARNSGARESRGDYLVFLDADDKLLPEALRLGLECLMENPESAFVSGHYRYINPDGTVLNEFSQKKIDKDHYLAFLSGNYVGMHATVMYRRKSWEDSGGFDLDLKSCEDYDLYLRLSRDKPVCRHEKIVAEYRQHDLSMSRDHRLMLESALRVLGKQWEHVKKKPESRTAYRQGIQFWRRYYSGKLLNSVFGNEKKRDSSLFLDGLPLLWRFLPVFFRAWSRYLFSFL